MGTGDSGRSVEWLAFAVTAKNLPLLQNCGDEFISRYRAHLSRRASVNEASAL